MTDLLTRATRDLKYEYGPMMRRSKSYRGLIRRIKCLVFNHRWEYQRKGYSPFLDRSKVYSPNGHLYLPHSRFMCLRCGQTEWWEENEDWVEIRKHGVPSSFGYYYGYIPNEGQYHLIFDAEGFKHYAPSVTPETRVTYWRKAYNNPEA